MAALSTNRVAWNYTADDGTVYRVAAQLDLVAQGVLGGSASSGAIPSKPGGLKMRRCTVSNAAGHSRVVHVYDTAATIRVAGTVVNANHLGNSEAYTSNGVMIGESGAHGPATKQTT